MHLCTSMYVDVTKKQKTKQNKQKQKQKQKQTKRNETKRNETKRNQSTTKLTAGKKRIEKFSIYHKFLFLSYIRGSMLVRIKVVAIQVKVVGVAFPLDFDRLCAS